MVILTTVELPKQFTELTQSIDESLVDEILIGKATDKFKLKEGREIQLKNMGGFAGFAPKSKTILINMDAVITDATWIRRGIRLSAAVWMSLVYGLYHELIHAWQLKEEPQLAQLDELPREYEVQATENGLALMADYLAHHNLPRIEEMGYLGQLILNVFQHIMPKMPNKVKEELQLNGTNAAAELSTIAALTKEIEIDEIERLMARIDEGVIGQKVDNKYYLTAYEAFDCK